MKTYRPQFKEIVEPLVVDISVDCTEDAPVKRYPGKWKLSVTDLARQTWCEVQQQFILDTGMVGKCAPD